MFRLHLKIDETTLANVRRGLGERQHRSRNAVSGAINETLAETKTRSARRIYEKFNLSSARIKQDIRLKKSTPQTLSGEVVFEHKRPIGLRQFGARQTAKGVTYAIERGKRQLAAGAFIQTAKGGEHVFIRYMAGAKRVARYKIHRLVGISVKEAFGRSGLAEDELATTQATFEKNLQQRINAIVGGWTERRRAA